VIPDPGRRPVGRRPVREAGEVEWGESGLPDRVSQPWHRRRPCPVTGPCGLPCPGKRASVVPGSFTREERKRDRGER